MKTIATIIKPGDVRHVLDTRIRLFSPRFFIGYWINTGLDFYPAFFIVKAFPFDYTQSMKMGFDSNFPIANRLGILEYPKKTTTLFFAFVFL